MNQAYQVGYVDHSDGFVNIRCPHCNAFDKAWDDARGIVECEECGNSLKIPTDRTKDTVPANVKAEMEAVAEHNHQLLNTQVRR